MPARNYMPDNVRSWNVLNEVGDIGEGLASRSGGEVGNGGGGIVCRDTTGNVTSVKALDVYEAEFRDMELDFGPDAEPLQIVDYVLGRLARIDPKASEVYKTLAHRFFDTDMSRFKKNITLPFTEDTGPVAPPAGCKIEQIVLQWVPQFPEDRLFTINADLWGMLDKRNQAALILHEVIYNELLGLKHSYREQQTHTHKTSYWARWYNERLLAKNFSAMTYASYAKFFGQRNPDVKYPDHTTGDLYMVKCDNHRLQADDIVLDLCGSEVRPDAHGKDMIVWAHSEGPLQIQHQNWSFSSVGDVWLRFAGSSNRIATIRDDKSDRQGKGMRFCEKLVCVVTDDVSYSLNLNFDQNEMFENLFTRSSWSIQKFRLNSREALSLIKKNSDTYIVKVRNDEYIFHEDGRLVEHSGEVTIHDPLADSDTYLYAKNILHRPDGAIESADFVEGSRLYFWSHLTFNGYGTEIYFYGGRIPMIIRDGKRYLEWIVLKGEARLKSIDGKEYWYKDRSRVWFNASGEVIKWEPTHPTSQ